MCTMRIEMATNGTGTKADEHHIPKRRWDNSQLGIAVGARSQRFTKDNHVSLDDHQGLAQRTTIVTIDVENIFLVMFDGILIILRMRDISGSLLKPFFHARHWGDEPQCLY